MNGLVLFLALAVVAPRDGATVPLLRPEQREYLAAPDKVRFARLDDAAARQRLYRQGYVQVPLKLEWKDAGDGAAGGQMLLAIEPLPPAGGDKPRSQLFVVTNATAAYVTNLELGRKYRWSVRRPGELESASGTFATESQPPRLLRVGGVVNARDLGGWTGLGGRKVRQGRVLRSGGFRGSATNLDKSIFSSRFEIGATDITEEGVDYLRNDFGVRTDLELRGVMETVGMEKSALGEGVRFVNIPFAAYNFIDNMVRGREPFVRLFRIFADEASYPVAIHCAGGRDRTGTLVFLLLGILGVSDSDLCREWECSVFSEASVEFGSARLERLTGYLRSLGGRTLAESCEIYARRCGVTAEEIASFRDCMLEREVAK